MMKKTLKVMAMLLFVVSMTTLTSCKKENTKLIVGRWECVTASYTDDGITESIPALKGMVWEFKADGKVVADVSIDLPDIDIIEADATYVVSGDVLTIKSVESDGDIDTEKYLIKELTKSKLMLEERDDDEVLVLEFKKK
jgi:uncharacterized protein (TIGR03066 family)